MKTKKIGKTLMLNKETIANFGSHELEKIKGGRSIIGCKPTLETDAACITEFPTFCPETECPTFCP